MITLETLEAGLKRVLAAQLFVSEDLVVPAARLVQDLGADSIDLIEILAALEDEFSMAMSDAEFAMSCDTVQSVSNLFASKLQLKRAS